MSSAPASPPVTSNRTAGDPDTAEGQSPTRFVPAATNLEPLASRRVIFAIRTAIPVPSRGIVILWLLALAIYGGAYQAQFAWGERPIYHITGDEPHYLTIVTSLIRDGDLEIFNNYRDKDYLPFYPWHLGDPRDPEDMHALYGTGGNLYSKHSIGLPLLILPAMWLGGHGLAIGFMMALSALLSTELWRLARDIAGSQREATLRQGRQSTRQPGGVGWAKRSAYQSVGAGRRWSGIIATATWFLVVTASPLFFYSDQFYPEVPGALLVTVALRALLPSTLGTASFVRLALVVSLLPWFHLRYIPIATVIATCGLVRWAFPGLSGPRPDGKVVHGSTRNWTAAILGTLIVAVAGGGLLTLDMRLFGGIPAVNDYGSVSLSNIPAGALGLLFDRQYGLLPYGPVYLLALYGLLALPRQLGWVRSGPMLTLLISYFAFIASFSFWFGAFSPPSRMLVPVMPIFVAGLAVALHRWRGWRMTIAAIALALADWAIIAQLIAVPRLRYNYWDGKSVLLAYLSEVWETDITQVLPTFVVPEQASYVWAAWAMAGLVGIYVLITINRPVSRSNRNANRHRNDRYAPTPPSRMPGSLPTMGSVVITPDGERREDT
ncbi:MAG: hypothetical protein DWI69_05055 [Chloroflexi bacterium]|nr:MAG: hypothetical protein DWI69_05055 [Chloroflexota bacterium]